MPKQNDRTATAIIAVLSIVIPAVVAWLVLVPASPSRGMWDVSFLPLLNAIINSTVTCLLIAGVLFIKRKQITQHRVMMVTAFFLSCGFLVSYVLYHYLSEETRFHGTGAVRYVYFFILMTHIMLSVVVVPLALFSIWRGLKMEIAKHRRIVKWTFPVWLYVSITGVLVYLFVHVWNPSVT